jgi:hypothetical protein
MVYGPARKLSDRYFNCAIHNAYIVRVRVACELSLVQFARSDVTLTTFYKIFSAGSVILPLTLTLLIFERLPKCKVNRVYSSYDYSEHEGKTILTINSVPIPRLSQSTKHSTPVTNQCSRALAGLWIKLLNTWRKVEFS